MSGTTATGYQWRPQKRFRVRMKCADGRVVGVSLMSRSAAAVRDEVQHRRVATPGDLVSFSVEEIADGA